MRAVSIVFAVLLAALGGPAQAQGAPGQMKGGVHYTLPDWFRASFLHFADDVAEARKRGKHVLVFLHLDECPYCARTLNENFTGGESRDFIEKNFDVVAINIRGGLETVWIDGVPRSERALADHLRAFGTPTIILLGEDGSKVLQLTGYRDPRALRLALEFVQSKSYRTQQFAEYLAAHEGKAVYALRNHPQFATRTDFKGYKQPLAVIFEDRQCAECARFHEKTLNHPEVLEELKKFLVVRLDADSRERVVDPFGNATTPARWAESLGLTYRPSVVLYNEGREVVRIDARLYHYHFKERLRYVSGAYYRQYDSLSHYSAARREELLKQGVDINYAE